MEIIYRNLKLEVKVGCWKEKAPEKKKADSIKGWGKKTPVQTILFSLLQPSLKPQIWEICVTRSISSSDKGIIPRSSVGKCHVKINQSQSIRTEKHTYLRRSVALSPRTDQQFPALFYPSVKADRLSYNIDNKIKRFLHYVTDGPQEIQSTKITGTDCVLSWIAHPSSGFRILSKRHQVRAIMYEITKNFFTSLWEISENLLPSLLQYWLTLFW